MIYSAATVPVNPAGELPLTRDQLWRGLVLKATTFKVMWRVLP